MEPDIVGERLKWIRLHRGLTLRHLARLSGVPVATLSLVERGERPGTGLSLASGRKLAETLGVTLDWLSGVLHERDPALPRPAAGLCPGKLPPLPLTPPS
jgi:transcriptional regulator with XRE-family HTH domain